MTLRRTDLAYAVGLGAGLAGLVLFGLLRLRIAMLGIDDLSTIWTGPRAFLLALDPYDPVTWQDTATRIGTAHTPDTEVYLYPPWVTIALAPLALLSSSAAGVVWSAIGIVTAVVAVRALLVAYLADLGWAHGLVGLLLVLSAPAAVTFLTGQWTFLFVAGLCWLVLLLRSGHPVAAGIVSLFMLVKPPLFVFTSVALGVRELWPRVASVRDGRRFVLAGLAAAAIVVGISWLILPSWWPAWFQYSAAVQVTITPVTLRTLFEALFGPPGSWIAAAGILGGAFVALQFAPRGDGWLPVWLAFSSAGVIYSNTYDALLLLVPMILAAGALRPVAPWRSALVLVTGAVLLLPVMWYLHTMADVRLYAAIVPLTMFVVIAAALWPERRETATAALRASGASARGSAGSSPP